MYIEQCVSLIFLFWGEVGKFRSSQVVPRERVRSLKSESRRGKLLRDGCACVARVKLGMRNVGLVILTTGYKDVTHYWPRLQLGIIDPAFPGNSLRVRISSDPNFENFYSLIHGHPNTVTNKSQEIPR